MPKKLEQKLKREATRIANAKGMTGKKREEFIGRYVYGTLQEKTNWKPSGRKAKYHKTPTKASHKARKKK